MFCELQNLHLDFHRHKVNLYFWVNLGESSIKAKGSKVNLTFSMYDLNHMGGGSSSGLFPLVSLTATCFKSTSVIQPDFNNWMRVTEMDSAVATLPFYRCHMNEQAMKDSNFI